MSDHLIAEAHRHAMALPTTHPTHADIAWYVREVAELRAEVKESKARERAAIASWDEERQRALREGGRVVELRAELALLREWQQEVIQNANAHHAERKDAIARAESAEREAFDWKKIARYEAARAERAEAELSAEQDKCDKLLSVLVYADQILDDIDTCSDAHKPMYSTYSQNVFKLCIKGRDARRAAIDAAMKKGAK